MTFTMNDPVRSGAHELGEQWTVDRRLYLTEDKQRVVEEGDPDGRWLWAGPGKQVPLAQAKLLGAIPAGDEDLSGENVEDAANAGVAADHVRLATLPIGNTGTGDDDLGEEDGEDVETEQKQAPAPENKMVAAPDGDKARPDAKTVRAWAKDNGVEVPAKGRIPDEVMDAYYEAH